MQVELLTTRTRDDVLLHGAFAPAAGSHVGVLVVHGAWGNFYVTPGADLLEAGPRHGLTVLSMNSRAHDLGTLGDGEPFTGFVRHRFTECVYDLDAAAAVLRERGVDRFVVVAHSYGAHVAAYWALHGETDGLAGLFLPSPGPRLEGTDRWFVEGSLAHHIARAAAAVAAGEPHRLMVLSSVAPVPMVADAETVLETWGPNSPANSEDLVGRIDVPVRVAVGRREPTIYRDYAERVAAAAGTPLQVLADDHYYVHDRAGFVEAVLAWVREDTDLLDAVSQAPVTR